MKHLRDTRVSPRAWCGREGERTENPDKSDCTDCLREAATYGARCAMRCAAVEAGASSDPEIAAERDHAVAELDKLRVVLGQHSLFACGTCARLLHVDLVGFRVGTQAWCKDCAGARGRIL